LAKTWDVFTLVPHSQRDPEPDWVTKQYTYRQWRFPYLTDLNPHFVRSVRRVLSAEDIDIVHGSKGICTVKLVTWSDEDTKRVYAAQNVEADHVRDFVSPDLPAYKRLLAPEVVPLVERLTISCADAMTTVSEKDRERFVQQYGVAKDRIRSIPTGTEAVEETGLESPSAIRERYGLRDRSVAVFHGYYSHYPNREAAKLIDERVAPAVRKTGLDVEFLVVGKDPPATTAPNVTTVGFVDDLYSVLRAADIAVVPIRHGGGTKTKVYDYVTLGLPIVTTRKGVEGIDLEPETHALVTEDVDDRFVDGIQQLVTDRGYASEMSENLRSLADEWNWDRSASRLAEFYESL
jgi:glycosyltransferase involved in cell wall biosynthesis